MGIMMSNGVHSILDLIRESIHRFENKEALNYVGRSYTYGELDRITGKLAAYLNKCGVGRGSVVSVLVPRNEYMSIASLGILRSGAAYQPLDASYPVERIDFMIENADTGFIITTHENGHLLSEDITGKNRRLLYVEDIVSLPDEDGYGWPDIMEQDLFVILYTSGSTGVPKGIMLTHGNILSFAKWYADYYEVDADCRMGQHPSYVFDLAIAELLLPYTAGAAVYIIPDHIRTDLLALNSFFEDNVITHVTMTTQLGRQFAISIKNHSLRHLTVGGEALTSVDPPEGYTLHNGYGPAECTLFVTMFPVKESYPEKVPLGRPISDVEIYILDEHGNEVPDNTVGELCISGLHVAAGYLNSPELTMKAFTDNPFSKRAGYERLYHTGDLAFRRSDGLLEFMGRADRQIKIRGFRIEPAEVEAALREFKDIEDAVVTAIKLGSQMILTAYYISEDIIDEGRLSQFILLKKPSYMLPSFFIRVNSFPLNTNGKIDYDRLPKPSFENYKAAYEEPENETERKISGIYALLLNTERVGRNDDFMLIGGNSILIAGLIYSIEKELSVRLSVRDVMENPTVVALALKVEEKHKNTDILEYEPMSDSTLPEQEYYEISKAQERIYTAQALLADDDPTYLISAVINNEEPLDIVRIMEVLSDLFRIHESLRSSFQIIDGKFVQKIQEASYEWIDRAVESSRVVTEPIGFMLDKAPLFWWKYEGNRLIFYWHHIINDGVGASMFASEFVALYNGQEIDLPRLHQKEYAAWERRQTETKAYNKGRDAWRKLFVGYDDIQELQLPQDSIARSLYPGKAGHEYGIIEKELSGSIDVLCKNSGVTPYMFFIAVYFVLLYKYSGQRRFITGTVMDGRSDQYTERMQGMFACTVPVLTDIREGDTFSGLLRQVKERILDCHTFKHIAIEDIAADFMALGGYTRTSHDHLLFDYFFTMRDFGTSLSDINNRRAWVTFPADERPMYDITLETGKDEGCYNYFFEYDMKLFRSDSVSIMSRHYVNLIRECINKADRDIDTLSMTDAAERKELLRLAAGDECPYRQNTVIKRIEDHVVGCPDKTAVIFRNEVVSYETLWIRSGRIAEALVRSYVTDRTYVGRMNRGKNDEATTDLRVILLSDRCTGMIASILGILRSGAGYVPVSLEYPAERIVYLLKDCMPHAMVVCGYELPSFIKEEADKIGITVLTVSYDGDVRDDTVGKTNGTEELPQVSMDRIAYMIYTSGTSGEPKGVVVEHRQLSAMLDAYGKIYDLDKEDTVLQFANFVFDQSVWDIFHILTVGGTLCLIPKGLNNDPDALARYCEDNKVTVASLTPGYLRLLSSDNFKSLRLLDVGGEAPDRSLLLAWSRGRTVYNTYGPTETTVNASSYVFAREGVLSDETDLKGENVPIGRPAPGLNIYIMQGNELCGIGVPGELCIAGKQVARGYHNRPDLTAERFTDDPFTDGKLYRSGDLARMLPDGNIEFISRLDNQVKIRGFRIELEEVESAMRSIASVRNAVVIVKDSKGEKLLCGYYVPKDPEDPGLKRIRKELKNRIPEYMVPSVLVPLEELPLTINGKINRNLLPDPGDVIDRQTIMNDYCAPVTQEERDCCMSFEKVLGLKNVSVSDDFLSLGGDSIKAIRIVALLREKGYAINASSVLKSHSIKGMAAALKRNEQISYREYDTVRPTPVMRMFAAAHMPEPSYYNQSTVFLVKGKVDIHSLEWALNGLIYCHGMLRMYLKNDGNIGIRDAREAPVLTLKVYGNISSVEREKLMNDINSSMDLMSGKVMGAAVFEDGKKTYLFLSFHHYVIDEVSWDIITEDINTLYEQAVKKKLYSRGYEESLKLLPDSTVSFGEWSESLWKYGSNNAFRSEKEYWMSVHEELESSRYNISEWLDSYKRNGSDTEKGYGTVSRTVDKVTAHKLKTLAQLRYGAGPETVLMAVLCKSVFDSDGVEVLLLQMESHGRTDAGILPHTERTVGWFTAVYPVILHVHNLIDEQIIELKELMAGIPNSGIGYGLMFDDLTELGGLVFNYLGSEKVKHDSVIEWTDEYGGVEISPVNVDPETISVNIRDTGAGFKIECLYDKVFEAGRIERIVDNYVSMITTIVRSSSRNDRIYTPSDFCVGRILTMDEWRIITDIYSPQDIEMISPLTPLQQGMLYRYMIEPDSSAYFLQDRLTIKGEWDGSHFEKALQAVFVRFDVLRIQMLYSGLEQPVQIILKEDRIKPEIIYSKAVGFDEMVQEDLERGMNPSSEIMFRVTIPEKAIHDADMEVLITSHHCILDGWSFSILIDTFMNYYQMLMRGVSPEYLFDTAERESRLGCSFADFLRNRAGSHVYGKLETWNKYLEGIDEGTGIFYGKDNEGRSGVADFVSFTIDGQSKERIHRFAEKNRITTGCFFGCVWGILLGFENNTDDVVFGETVSGRENGPEGITSAVGMFINTVPVRIKWTADTKVHEVFRQRQEDYYTMQDALDVPLDRAGTDGIKASDLISTHYVYENFPETDNNDRYQYEMIHEEVDYPISVSVEEGSSFTVSIQYDKTRYDRRYIDLLVGRYMHIIDQITSDLEHKMGELARIPTDERRMMLGDMAGIKCESPNQTVLDMIRKTVMKNPDAKAVSGLDSELSYRELWILSARLAGRIGYGGERFIALFCDRGVGMIISMIAAFMSGGAYVPLDPDYPDERIKYIIKDCGAETILRYTDAETDGREELFTELGLRVIDVDVRANSHDEVDEELVLPSGLSGDRLAYMIYTSGTTGEPKGVEVGHSALAGMVISNIGYYGFFDMPVLQAANYVFDASLQEIFVTLGSGGTVCTIPRSVLGSAEDTAEFCRNKGVRILITTNALLQALDPAEFGDLKIVCAGGDAANAETFAIWSKYTQILVNDYGPTEACVNATVHTYETGDSRYIPIGTPYRGKRVYVMQGDELCGIGQKGEICIGGNGLARGYHNRDELNRQKFTDNPYEDGQIYHSGDIGVYGLDKELRFLGREDDQIKIRGFRIETGEIENCIRKYEPVKEVAVINRKDGDREPYLVAYITSEEELDLRQLKNRLLKRLPAYMVPSVIERVDELPLTINGKLDIKALPTPKEMSGFSAPVGFFEQLVAGLFRKILRIERIGRNDSFFELGGSSIDVMKLVSGLHRYHIRVSDVAGYPTPALLGERMLNNWNGSERNNNGMMLLRDGRIDRPSIFCVPPSGGMSLCYIPFVEDISTEGRIFALTDDKYNRFGTMSLDELTGYDPYSENLWVDTVRKYTDSVVTEFKDGDILVGYSQGGNVAHMIAGILEKQGYTVGQIIMLESVPYRDEGGVYDKDKERSERLRTAVAIFTGSNVDDNSEDHMEEIQDVTYLRNRLKALMGEESSDTLLHSLYETYLVYSANVCNELHTEGRVMAKIDSILLASDSGDDAVLYTLSGDNPWASYTYTMGRTFIISCDYDEHLVFLSKYRSVISEIVKKLIMK
ncbi:MAG: amino acid adenylation domain-containing protein [Lachnospiraceae bacterium]|nr:amino acid adenylation domain-containing protein [Lachnospiraceae bacterium]